MEASQIYRSPASLRFPHRVSFPIGIKLALNVLVQRPQHADTRVHRRYPDEER
jgi:hypothetical protein